MTLTTTLMLVPTVLLFGFYMRKALRMERESTAIKAAAAEAGLIEPPSLHPVIDEAQCIGCGTCIDACPEKKILGLIEGKAHLLEPSHCIGHGACKAACPVGAITLVFGTERRGIDIPHVSPDFETNVPGIFIAGELGGMGLIRNAIEQGRQAMETIRKRPRATNGSDVDVDVVIVGAGPAGFSASLAAMQHGLSYVTIEQDTLGGTVAHYPRGKLVMTAPVVLPLVGRARFTETTKEKLLAFWQDVEKRTGVKIRYRERMEGVTANGNGFEVRTSRGSYRARNVMLTIGRRGTPRKLGVPGEDQPKVVYRLTDPAQYRGRKVLVVGGGDSALEAAIALADEPGTTVALSYRGDAFGRAKQKNRDRVAELESAGRLRVLLGSQVEEIAPEAVRLRHAERQVDLANDAVIVCAGGILPTPLLREIGIAVETKHGTV